MATIVDNSEQSIALFSAPIALINGDVIDSSIGLARNFNERKSIAGGNRVAKLVNGSDSIKGLPQKSQSAGDLASFRVRASAPVSYGNGTTTSGLVHTNSSYTQGVVVDPTPEKPKHVPTTKFEPQQHRYNKAVSASALVVASSLSFPDADASVNVSEIVEGRADRKLAHRERRFRRLFRSVPTTEVLLCRYSCAYVSAGLLLQGHLYISNSWICFHSNVFGIEKIIEIPAYSILSVSKANTAKIVPNAVKIKTEGKYYLFGSLISRDNTYRLLISVISRGRPENGVDGVANKHNFTSVQFGSVSSTQRGCAEDFDDGVSSSSSSLTAVSSSSSLAIDGSKTKSDFIRASTPAIGLATVEEPEPVVRRRVVHSNSASQRAQLGDAASRDRDKGNGNGLRKSAATTSSVTSLLTWFFGLPKLLTILILCVGLVVFLFLCATILTIRLIYIRNPSTFRMDFTPWSSRNTADFLSHRSLDNMGAVLDNTLRMVAEVKRYLESLQSEVRNNFAEAALATSPITAEES